MVDVSLNADPGDHRQREELYLAGRELEGRLLGVDAIRRLPVADPDSPHADEWRCRADSARRLLDHLRSRPAPGPVLDLGCGYGWMSALIASELGVAVVGCDLNRRELELAAEAFADVRGLSFVYADVMASPPISDLEPFGSVVMAAALQYFPEPGELFAALRPRLRDDGELVVADTPIYPATEVASAAERSRDYYDRLGVPGMAAHYHHHSWEALAPYSPEVLYRPGLWSRVASRLGLARSPFPLLCFRAGTLSRAELGRGAEGETSA